MQRSLLIALPAALLFACSSPGGGGPGVFIDASGDVQFGGDTAGGQDTTPPTSCAGPEDCPAETPWCSATGLCLQCLEDLHCPEGRCLQGLCTAATCVAGEATCSGNTQLTCRPDASGWDTLVCEGGTCEDGACVGCPAGERVCSGANVLECDASGTTYQPIATCPAGEQCIEGQCYECYPGMRRCQQPGVVEVCVEGGGWTLEEDCASQGLACLQGRCVSPCSVDIKGQSNAGCDYWAVDLDNHYDAQNGPYAVIVSNLSDQVATVTVSRKDNLSATPVEVMRRDVAPGGLATLNLPQRNMGTPGLHWAGYRVQATAPIIAYQFNPLDNVDVFSNDASLLLPVDSFGDEYIVISRFEFLGGGPGNQPIPYRGTISVIASTADTQVTVRPTARTQAAGAAFPAMQAGQTYNFTLQPYQVLNIKSDQDQGDLTGTIVTADKPIGVFSGHEAAISGSVCCADHLEQQMFPVRTWGTTYVAAKSRARFQESDYWRIVAAEADTVVTFNPAVSGPRTLGRGQHIEIVTDQDFVITATKPVMVGQILASSSEVVNPPAYRNCTADFSCATQYQCSLVGDGIFDDTHLCLPPSCAGPGAACMQGHVCTCFSSLNCSCTAVGDPTLILIPPVGQFRDDYVFLTPDKYAENYISVVAPQGATVTLDGQPVSASSFSTIMASSWRVARIPVGHGVHSITASEPVGVTVYGYDRDVSYGYPAGLNLTDL